jgi:RNA-directed DNA polymerase
MGKGASRLAASSTRRRSSVNTDALELSPDEAKAKVLHLQRKLHKWASADKHKRFCDLWNLVCDPAVLQTAWLRVRSNKGSRTAGVDGATRYYVENRYGVERFLFELRQELNDRSYRPLPVRERGIPKKRGQVRYLGIPALRDRVVQMALKLVLEPILESDFHASSYGYRPGRRTQDAIAEIVLLANHPASYEWVIEADVEACFDRLDHRAIMAGVERRIGDRRVLALLRSFLKAGVMTEAGRLERRLTGTPQGGIISPLLMNVALDALDREFETTPNERRQMRRKGLASYRLIRYADDFVVMVKGSEAQAEATMATLADSLARMGLVLSVTKTGLTHIDDGFDFLGFRIVRKSRESKRPCVYTFVSDEALAFVKRKVKALTSRSTVNLPLHVLIRKLNPILRGWASHFRYAAASQTFSYLGYYVWWRVVRWLRKKHQGRTWKWLWRRYQLPGSPQEAGQVLYNPAKMRIVRYRYRGSKFATPWDEVKSRTSVRQMSFDEAESLGWLQESLSA